MLINIMLVAGLGLLIKYVLVPGYKCNEIYGKGVELYFWGYDRHQWGSIHLIFSFVLIFLLILHVVLHWKMVTIIFKQWVGKKSKRRVITATLAIASVVLAISPLFISPEVSESLSRNKHVYTMLKQDTLVNIKNTLSTGGKMNDSIEIRNDNHIHTGKSDIEVFGYMTINEISKKHGISTGYLKAQIGIPASTSNNSRLGQLRRRYNFDMEDVRRVIINKSFN